MSSDPKEQTLFGEKAKDVDDFGQSEFKALLTALDEYDKDSCWQDYYEEYLGEGCSAPGWLRDLTTNLEHHYVYGVDVNGPESYWIGLICDTSRCKGWLYAALSKEDAGILTTFTFASMDALPAELWPHLQEKMRDDSFGVFEYGDVWANSALIEKEKLTAFLDENDLAQVEVRYSAV